MLWQRPMFATGRSSLLHPYFWAIRAGLNVTANRKERGQRTESHGVDAFWENTQIYEGTNQIQRVVMAKKLLG